MWILLGRWFRKQPGRKAMETSDHCCFICQLAKAWSPSRWQERCRDSLFARMLPSARWQPWTFVVVTRPWWWKRTSKMGFSPSHRGTVPPKASPTDEHFTWAAAKNIHCRWFCDSWHPSVDTFLGDVFDPLISMTTSPRQSPVLVQMVSFQQVLLLKGSA